MRFNNKNVILPQPPIDNRFRLEALENGSVVGLTFKSDQYSVLQYSLDGTTWNNFTTSTSETLNTGDKFYIRGKQTADIESGLYTNKLSLTTGKFAAKGNIMHLYDYEHPDATTISYRLPFGNLFQSCTALYDASELILPVTTFTTYGVYRYMFNGCSNLTAAPALPATTLYEYCYDYMFYGCSSLTEAPVLPAAVVPTWGYHQMFYNCSSLTKVISYATTISASECLGNWLGGSVPNTSSCHFYNLGGATYTRNVSGIPSNWTVHTSLPLYTEYRYLQFTSNSDTSGSLFNSGYYANANTKIVLKCILQNSENGNTGQGILGTRASASDSNAWLISWAKTDSTRGRYYGNTGTGAKYDASSSHGVLASEITITMTMSTATITDGTTTYTINFGTTSRGTTSDPLILGGWWAGDANKYLAMLGYWGECEIYENDVLIHDFVPCTRNSDSAVGLWDKSTDAFITPIDTNYIPTPTNSAS